MKKNTLYITVISLLMMLSTSCTDWLDEKVYTQLPVASYGKTEAEVNSLIAPIYTGLRTVNNPITIAVNSSDMAITPTRKGGDWWDGGVFKELRLGTWTPITSHIRSFYNSVMQRISQCNQILYLIENSEGISDKEPYICQVRAARAFWYYILCDYFGNVPIVTDFTDLSKPATKTRAEVFNFVVSELNDIKDKIRSDVGPASYGKFTKGAVYTILAKMYLNALEWNPDGGPKWQECIDACDVVMSLPYKLVSNWYDNFKVFNENCPEHILTAINSPSAEMGVLAYTLHYLDYKALGTTRRGNNGLSAMPDYVRQFDLDDKRRGDDLDHKPGSFLIGPMKDLSTGQIIMTAHGRPLIHTIDITMKYGIDADGWGQVEQEDGARCFKWEIEKGVNYMQNDCAIFRLADVYLMKAECLVRLGQNNEEATRLVNEIRKRAFDDPAKLKTSVTLDDIYLERRLELAWESYCRQDMIRFGKFCDPIPGWRGAIPEYRKLFPIPQTAIDANPLLKQNPGY
ncbi:MAG: RagB/SusD family nutrient uptake outer membrane protein [Bacteroidales bacterium]